MGRGTVNRVIFPGGGGGGVGGLVGWDGPKTRNPSVAFVRSKKKSRRALRQE